MNDADYKIIIPSTSLHIILELLYERDLEIMEDILNQVGEDFRPRYFNNEGDHDQFRNDVEADADALASAGYGNDEDYEHPGSGDE